MNILDIALTIHEQKLASISPEFLVPPSNSEPNLTQSQMMQSSVATQSSGQINIVPQNDPPNNQAQPQATIPNAQPQQQPAEVPKPPVDEKAKKEERKLELQKDDKLMKYFKMIKYGVKKKSAEEKMKEEGYDGAEKLQVII